MKIFVIGAGVASLAFCSFLEGKDINVIEKNDYAGRKLLATGNGRCNFTNLNMSYDKFVGNKPEFAKDALDLFTGKDLRDYFEEIGIEWLALESGRCYPKTMSSKTVNDSLFLNAKENANFIFSKEVKDIDFKNKLIITNQEKYKYDILVIASGGQTLKNSGSDGKMFDILKKVTKITKRSYGITNYETREKISKKSKGTKVKAKASLFIENKFVISSNDDIIFQDYGLTGTAIFDLSNHISLGLLKKKKIRVDIDFYPEYSSHQLFIKLRNKAKKYPNRNLEELLLGLVQDKLIIEVLKRSKIEKDKKAQLVADEALKKICSSLKAFSFEILKIHDENNAQVTLGGIDCGRIDSKTMKSLDIDDVYFIGEVVDIAGACGGYNIQWAFSSAKSASDDIRRLNV